MSILTNTQKFDLTKPYKPAPLDIEKGEFRVTLNFEKKQSSESEGDLTKSKFLGTIKGFASTDDVDLEMDLITPRALKNAAPHLEQHNKVFFNHEYYGVPPGKVLSSQYIEHEGKKGIYVEIGVSKNYPEIWTAIDEGTLDSLSIAGRFLETDFKDMVVNGEDTEVRLINKMELWEVSIVGMPANPAATFSQAKMIDVATTFLKTLKKGDLLPPEQEKIEQEKIEQKDLSTATVIDHSEDIAELKGAVGDLTKLMTTFVQHQLDQSKAQEIAATPASPSPAKFMQAAPRQTPERESQSTEVKFESKEHAEFHEKMLFGEALMDEDYSAIDLHGDLVMNTHLSYGEGYRSPHYVG